MAAAAEGEPAAVIGDGNVACLEGVTQVYGKRIALDDVTLSLPSGCLVGLIADRPAKKLSGGMRQKLGLCCSLIHDE